MAGAAEKPVLLVLTSTYPRWSGDHEPSFVHELSRRLTDEFSVTVLAPHAAGARTTEAIDGVEVVRYRYAPEWMETLVHQGGMMTNLRNSRWKWLLLPTFMLAQTWSAWRLCRRKRVDVIHAHWLLPQGLIAWVLSRRGGRRYVVTSHGADLYALRGRLLQRFKTAVSNAAAEVTVVSAAMRHELNMIGVDSGRVHVAPMGVDMDRRFTLDESSRSVDEILFVGRLVEKKGADVLLRAFPHILRKRPASRVRIVGFGPEERRLRQLARDLDVEASVRFEGPATQEELPSHYRRAAVLVAPFVTAVSGDQEGLGLVVLEAIGCGCPVVVSALPAVHDVMDPVEDASILVAPADECALAEAVLRVLADPAEAAVQAHRRRARVAGRFGWDAAARVYAERLRNVVEKRKVETAGFGRR